MKATWFEESQRLRDNPWVWPLLAILTLSIFLPFGMGIYQQLVLGEPWGKEPMGDNEMIYLSIFLTVCWAIAMFMMLFMKLEIKIDEEGIHYRFFPISPSWKLIRIDEIAEFSFEKKYKLFDGRGIGHHRNIFKKQRSFKIGGGKHLAMKMTDGRRLLLGTQNLDGLEWAMKKLMVKTK
jgi:hypothetical protein